MKKEYKATLETRTSKKGVEYQVLVIKLTDTYEKTAFLEKAELEIIKLENSKSNLPFGK